ncbi:MAG TPA: SDR family NAD(P)-dependent oxidoreductase [Acidimicrobiales bacterium]|nr:SDR family NAD(P)-dependent oxidoreductase [Acidimicrobiales bacterium]
MGYDVTGKRVLVTGASSGIGAGLAVALAKAGATVGICARREDRLKEVLAQCVEHAPASKMWVTDLSVPEEVDALADVAVEELGGVDVLVNNAGIPKRRHVTKLDISTVEAVANLDYFSAVRLTLALLPQMLDRGEGRIVNVSSVAATLSSPGEAAYAAAKAALSVWSEGMAVDLWDTGVKVLVVYPGVVDTELFALPDNDAFTAEVEKITVEECVATVLAALEREELQVYVPAWFADVAARKASDVAGFLAGTAAYVRGR